MNRLFNIRTIKTKEFTVTVDAVEDVCPDLSWDETGEVVGKINDGTYWLFCARARCEHAHLGILAEDYLGNCVYKDAADFVKDGYFRDMVKSVCVEARKAVNAMTIPTMRQV